MSETEISKSIVTQVMTFFNDYAEDLETCNPEGYMLLESFIKTGELKKLEDFMWYHADELDACFPDAFEELYKIAIEFNMEI